MKNPTGNLFRTALLSPALFLTLAATQPMQSFAQPAQTPATTKEAAYAAGTQAMNQQQWADAVTSFDKVINAKAKRTDAALYWKAYSLNKLGNKALALATCYQLRSQYTASNWNKDCNALSIDLNPDINTAFNIDTQAINNAVKVSVNADEINDEIKASLDARGFGKAEKPESPEEANADIKLLALNSVLRQDPDRALPILRGILTGNQSPNVKRRALFILAQSKSPEAQTILHDAAVGKMDPALQRQAIESMAIFQGARANDTLAEVYRNTSDPQIKRAVINAFFITHDASRLVDLARNEKDLNTKRDIVSKLALMHDKVATDYMLELLK